ncbi:recombination protein RecR [Candidatus Dependentiae bacterium]|nr:recombination protein RecR [Candidatus Dependentiae bacterium]
MIEQSPSLLALLRQLQRVPYLASKNLYIVAQHFLDLDQQGTEQFCNALLTLKERMDKCTDCFSWKEKERGCSFCASSKRDKTVICVVETWRDLIALEKSGGYFGLYHVLGGALCPLDGIGPDDLTIKQLVTRIDRGCAEIIFAFNQTPEGEATASYISTKLKGKSLKISCLARGLPVGSSLEAMDRLTVYKALSERRPF